MSYRSESDYAFKAEARALHPHIADLPHPLDYVQSLPLAIVDALARCVDSREGARAVDYLDARALRLHGLCDCQSNISDGRDLTNFGCDVRRKLMELLAPREA